MFRTSHGHFVTAVSGGCEVSSTLEEVLASLLREPDDGRTLPERLLAVVQETIDVTAVALTLSGPDEQLLLASSDSLASQLAKLEITMGEGPGADASCSGGPVLVADLRARKAITRWPGYTAEAGNTPVRAQFAFPLQIGVIHLGVLSLSRDQPGSLSDEDLESASVFADAATVLLLHMQDTSAEVGDLPVEVGRSFVATAELHQATGMVSVQAGVGMTEALLLLHGRAFSSARTSLEVARDVLAGKINFRNGRGHDGRV